MADTDVAGRGLDFSQVSHIFNYDFPGAAGNYVHRTGRTGRMGREGIAISLVTGRVWMPSNGCARKSISWPPGTGERDYKLLMMGMPGGVMREVDL